MPRLEHRALVGPTKGTRTVFEETHLRWGKVSLIGALVGVFCSVASAAVLTVGDHGTYATIQAAVGAALGAGTTEIRVERGTYVEHVYITSSFVSDQIEITGGWDMGFATRSTDASLTVIDGGAVANQVVGISIAGGTLLVDGFTITNGSSSTGGGLRVSPTGGWVTVSNNRIIGNTASGSLPGGGGVYFRENAGGDARFSLTDNLISGNTVENTAGGSAGGGGVMLYAHDGSYFEATGNRIIDNSCLAPLGTAYGCGVSLYHDSTGVSEFSDNLIRGNRTTTAAGTDVQGAGGSLGMGNDGGGSLTARRNLWIDNRDVGTQEGYHVKFSAQSDHLLTASDSVVAGGPDVGVGMWSYDTSTLRLTNLTVFDHADLGVHFRGFGVETTLFNTIVFGSTTSTDVSGSSYTTGNNLLGVDPLFADPAGWDCRLRPGSPAFDDGDNSPPGGLGPTDADGNPRVLNGVVDYGAYEGVGPVFEDGFESGTTWWWSRVVQ